MGPEIEEDSLKICDDITDSMKQYNNPDSV